MSKMLKVLIWFSSFQFGLLLYIHSLAANIKQTIQMGLKIQYLATTNLSHITFMRMCYDLRVILSPDQITRLKTDISNFQN